MQDYLISIFAGTCPDYFAFRDWRAAKGSLFTSTDGEGQN
jgi:hypothetical protein